MMSKNEKTEILRVLCEKLYNMVDEELWEFLDYKLTLSQVSELKNIAGRVDLK